MQYNNQIKQLLRTDLPKLLLFDEKSYESQLNSYKYHIKGAKETYLVSLNVRLTYEDTEQLVEYSNINAKLMVFFLNYLQNENLLKGEELSQKMYFCLIKILSFDDKGNLEYNIQSNVSQYLFLPTFINEEFEEIILLISDENKWYSVYLNLGQKKGQVIDFKNGEKVSMEQILQILEEIIQREFKIEINLFDFNVIFNSLQIDNDMGYFFINFYYKYIHGQQIDQIRFNFKEKDILKQRCEQIIFKLKEIEDAKQKSTTIIQKKNKIDNFSAEIPAQTNQSEDEDIRDYPQREEGRLKRGKINSESTKMKLNNQQELNLSFNNDVEDINNLYEYQESQQSNQNLWDFLKRPEEKIKQEKEFASMWNFTEQQKKAMRNNRTRPVLIPLEQKEQYRDISEKATLLQKMEDIQVLLGSNSGKELLKNQEVLSALERMKGIKAGSISAKNIDEIKYFLKQKVQEFDDNQDLDNILDRQQLIDKILKKSDDETVQIGKKFEQEIANIDKNFQNLMQKYDNFQYIQALPNFPNAQKSKLSELKDNMHLHLHNYLLSGLGLPQKYSKNQDKYTKTPEKISSRATFSNSSSMQSSVFSSHSVVKKGQEEDDVVASRYGYQITKLQMIRTLTNDDIDENMVNFVLKYMEERHFQQGISRMIQNRSRILLFSTFFYTKLSFNQPFAKQNQLNLSSVYKYTERYSSNKTIFVEFDKLIFPIRVKQNYSFVLVDILNKKVFFFNLIENQVFDFKQNENPIIWNILKYLEYEYTSKYMKNFAYYDWKMDNFPCKKCQEGILSCYYLLLYIQMVYQCNYSFSNVNVADIKEIKMKIPEIIKHVGISENRIGEIKEFI